MGRSSQVAESDGAMIGKRSWMFESSLIAPSKSLSCQDSGPGSVFYTSRGHEAEPVSSKFVFQRSFLSRPCGLRSAQGRTAGDPSQTIHGTETYVAPLTPLASPQLIGKYVSPMDGWGFLISIPVKTDGPPEHGLHGGEVQECRSTISRQ